MIEKAAAKYYGNYENMEGGNMVESLYMLTGMPTKSLSTSSLSAADLWTQIKELDDAQYPMTASNPRPVHGLPGGHAYTLLGVPKLNDGTKMVKIRNPWGSEDYTGPYSDGKLTTAQKTELGHVSKDDGVFFMDIATFQADFSDVQFALYEDWTVDTQEATWDRTTADISNLSWTVLNSKTQDVVVNVDMVNKRHFPRGCSSADMPEYQFFHVKGSDGRRMTDRYGSTYSYTGGNGKGYLFFKDLPEGEVTFEIFNAGYAPSHSGTAHFTVNAFGKDGQVTLHK